MTVHVSLSVGEGNANAVWAIYGDSIPRTLHLSSMKKCDVVMYTAIESCLCQ